MHVIVSVSLNIIQPALVSTD